MKRPPAHPRRLAFLGTPATAVPPLCALVDRGYDIVMVVTRTDTRRGRGGAHQPSPVKAAALELGLPVTDRVDDIVDVGADLGVVVAFGRIIKPHVLDAVPMVNLHFSLLPRWRGAAPVERAILNGDDRTGVCLMAVEEGLDTGGVYRRAEIPIGDDATLAELRSTLVDLGTELLVGALAEGLGEPAPQEGEATYAAKIDPDELLLDWSRPAGELHRVVRVGGAWTTFRGRRLKVHRARRGGGDAALGPGRPRAGASVVEVGTGDGTLELVEVQAEGKARQSATAWANGARLGDDDRLGDG